MSALPVGMPVGMPLGPAAPVVPLDPSGPVAAAGRSGADFAGLLAQGLERVQGLQDRADDLSVAAATGDLKDVHDYTIAAAQASVATELATTLRNKGVEAFTEIMRMPL